MKPMGLTEDPNQPTSSGLNSAGFKPMGLNQDNLGAGPSEDVRINPGTWEYALASKYPTTMAVARTAADIVPFMWTLFDSGRQDFMKMGDGWKAFLVGADVAAVIPVSRLFKGAASLIQSSKLPKWIKMADRDLKSLTVAEQAIPVGSRFENVSLLEKIKTRYKVSADEAQGLIDQNKDLVIWKQTKQGAYYGEDPSGKFRSLLYGKKSKEFQKQLKYWRETPLSQQRADFYRSAWKKKLSEMIGEGAKFNEEEMFHYQLETLIGSEGKKFALSDASSRTMANVFAQLFDDPRAVSKAMDIGYHWLTPTVFLPARKAFGSGQKLFSSFDIYESIKGLFSRARSYELQHTTNFLKRMEDLGLGKLKTKKGVIVGFKRGPSLTKEVWKRYGEVMRELDDLASGKGLPRELGEMDFDDVADLIETQIADVLKGEQPIIRDLITKVHQPFHDDLYKDFMLLRIPQAILDKGLSQRGLAAFNTFWDGPNGMASKIGKLFDPKYDPPRGTRAQIVNKLLKESREALRLDWFAETNKKALKGQIKEILDDLTPSTKKKVGFPNYLENYATRINRQSGNMIRARVSNLKGTKQASFMHERKIEEAAEILTDPTLMLQTRIAGQAKELFVYPYLKKQLKTIGSMPEGYRNYFDYWLGRMLGEPTSVDYAVAQWMTRSVGGLARTLGKTGMLTSKDVANLAYRINDLTYLGGLGFKPYAVVRNLFQPLITVPTDLGGLKDIYWLTRGYKRALKGDTRELIRSYGAIAEYAEEMGSKILLPHFGIKIKGLQGPALQELRDVGMWLFKKSDEFNRYVTGGAALEKWEHYAQKYLSSGNKYAPQKFMKKMKFSGREDWVRRQLEDLIEKIPRNADAATINKYAEAAKAKFVTDVIADTQWLYGLADSPIITSRWGVISKTGMIFQTWWMNYMSALEKWFRRAPGWERFDKAITFMTSSAIAGELMVHGAGFKQSQAWKTVGLGPFPTEVNEFLIPPTWTPVYHALTAVATTPNIVIGEPEAPVRHLKALGRSIMMGVPAGLQIQKIIRGLKKGNTEDLVRESLNYYGFTGEQFLIPNKK